MTLSETSNSNLSSSFPSRTAKSSNFAIHQTTNNIELQARYSSHSVLKVVQDAKVIRRKERKRKKENNIKRNSSDTSTTVITNLSRIILIRRLMLCQQIDKKVNETFIKLVVFDGRLFSFFLSLEWLRRSIESREGGNRNINTANIRHCC